MWSPSSTETFLSCPRKWWLNRQGVVGRAQDESAREQGSAFHAAMAAYWNETTFVNESGLVTKAVERALQQERDALRERGVVGVEVNLKGDDAEAARHSRYPGICDLITDNGGGLTVTDYKTKNKMDAKYADGELRQTQRSWQLKQYAYFVQQKYGRPVTHVRKLLVAFAPALKVWLVSYAVTQQELSGWYSQARTVWEQMDRIEFYDDGRKVWQNAGECERYGWMWRCPYYETCWDGAPMSTL